MQQITKGKESEQESDIKSFDENKHNFEPDHKDSAEFSPRVGHFPDYLNAKQHVLLVRDTPITKSPHILC